MPSWQGKLKRGRDHSRNTWSRRCSKVPALLAFLAFCPTSDELKHKRDSRIYKDVATSFFSKNTFGATLNEPTCMSILSRLRKESKLKQYWKVIIYLLVKNATDYITMGAPMDVLNFEKPTGQGAVGYPKALWTNTYPTDRSTKNVLSTNNSLQCPDSQSDKRPSLWAENKSASLKELARHAISLSCLQLRNATPEK